MAFLNRHMVVLGICTALLCSIAICFLDRLVVVLATCAALAVNAVLNRQNKLLRLTSKIPAEAGQVLSNVDLVLQVNASVYELYRLGAATMEVLFFHGFQHGDYKDAHISTWTCGDGTIWPQSCPVEKFSEARILSVSYNAGVLKSRKSGTFDMYNIGENLTSDLLDADIGQEPCRPVVLVGHNFGGVVIKQLCAYASRETGGLKQNSERYIKLTAFLENVKGIFFYSTPP